MGSFTTYIATATGAYSLCVVIGAGNEAMTSLTVPLNVQGESACQTILADANL